MYRQVLDFYAKSVDYNPKSAGSVDFFKMVQNKLHYVWRMDIRPHRSFMHVQMQIITRESINRLPEYMRSTLQKSVA